MGVGRRTGRRRLRICEDEDDGLGLVRFFFCLGFWVL